MAPREIGVQCLLCKEIINCQQKDFSVLVDHVVLKHPDFKITNISTDEIFSKFENKIASEARRCTEKGRTMENNHLLNDCNGKNIPKYTEDEKTKKVNQIPTKQPTKRRRFYKTSGMLCDGMSVICFYIRVLLVETWKPGNDQILCPKCDAVVRPIIRTSADRVSHSTVGATLIMTCWPFCFFPFLFQAPIQTNLHCSVCGYYFGSYDCQKQKLNVPNNYQAHDKTNSAKN
ncbi:hypothetical protein Bhyg_04310 [Pseudolycoriella hygida]|uniref:LITAF domain-containing protein n=1 Tax=Pseudolycoriella hygida TaxID=35572 RepID=A0A9Q0NFT2_9DIPT|nr:hypothetical protein Bhyg_04310 [Pseudolycoriella hygida]